MSAAQYPEPANADGLSYEPGSDERKFLKAALAEMESVVAQVPSADQPLEPTWPPPAEYHEVDSETVKTKAIPGALEAREQWARMSFKDRASIYRRAAKMMESPKYRWKLMAATMIGQGKICGQAEGDRITEVIDTLNFHVCFCAQLYAQQPPKQFDASSSELDYRPLEGFVLAISPFNFTVLGAHIEFTPALLGNVILWKPSPMALLSNYLLYEIMEEAGLPKGVIQFLPIADPTTVVKPALSSSHFAALHNTGSSSVLRSLSTQIGTNTTIYKSFPRIVGESGGKNFHLIHNSCEDDSDWIASAAVRSAYEFQGQKCSALSRLYVPKSMWEQGDLKRALMREAAAPSARPADGHVLLYGGQTTGSKGFFVQPAIFEVDETKLETGSDLMTKELFGPLVAVQTYDDISPTGFHDVCKLIDETSEYALAGSILRDSVGMFCINDKSTGAVIGAHPFGGARPSGTNDKANSVNVLLRFSSIRCVKDSYVTGSMTLGGCHVPDRTLRTALATGILNPSTPTRLKIRHLIATVGTTASKTRVEKALSPHTTSHMTLTVLTHEENVHAINQSDVVILATKPFKRGSIFSAPGFKEAIPGKLILSIMAGITTSELARLTFGNEDGAEQPFQAVRAMPNMAARIREAVTLYTASDGTSREGLEIAEWVFSQVGQVHRIAEGSFDICAVLVGCAGSLLLVAVDGLLDAAVVEGVRRQDVQNLVVNSAIGMMKLVPAGEHPAVLREKIASPGGCSIRALLELEKLGVRSAFTSVIMAAAEKSKSMSASR
ncbi:ALDH-like protein [Aspergillus sclerotiicarbonarius CBS 121057]|uniref:L-glutamate gamma-semialdehyde dehydrogenase n=1 Tax=Aspergillus sclerotiicarbonarius (strain CBS 121057 / IBT 28362) TaxID=1448318 RepID=A0A319EAN6_ASPSB|nr:ALDH-like protein [Aspergillus sclerotiicarbonarius CBS 121057]